MTLKIGAFGSEKAIARSKSEMPDLQLVSLGDIGSTSFRRVSDFVGTLDAEEIVLIFNAEHTLLKGNSIGYAAELEFSNCDILFSASAAFRYDDEVLRYYFWKYYPREKTVYHYLDSNAFIGKAGKIKELIERIGVEYPVHFSWHDLLTRYYVDFLLKAVKTDLRLKLDRNQVLFGNVDGRSSAFKWPLLSWMHADLFSRKETQALDKINQRYFQDQLWDITYSKKRFFPYNSRQKSTPSVWIVTGEDAQIARLDARLKNQPLGGKGIGLFLLSFWAYLGSLFSFFAAWLINRGETRPFRIFRYAANKNPEWDRVIQKFLGHLERKEGFTFAHFNDGEMTFIKKYLNENHAETWFGRRQQKYNKVLGQRLTEAIKLEKDRYHVGIPCSTSHPKLRALADSIVGGNTGIVPAMTLHHNIRFFPNIINHMKDRECFFVKNEHQKLDVFEKLGVEIKQENLIIVPFKNSYLLYDELKDRKFPDGAIVILICGMLAKIIIPAWFENNPNGTFLALGSSMDDFIQRTNTKFTLYPTTGLPLTCNIQPTKFFAFGWKKECPECWKMEEEFEV
jgi:hypothetical protein